MDITSAQFTTYLQNIQTRHIKLELLNFQYQTVDTLEGNCLSGAITIDANADIRRTGTLSLIVTDSSFEVESGSKIWLDKYIRVFVGTDSIRTGQTEYINCGMFIIDAPNYQYDASTNTLNLSLVDLMAKLTGMRNGYLPGVPVVLKAGENIRKAIIDTLALGGFTKYIVEEAPSPSTIPNDLEFNQGSTVYEVLSGLRDIYPNYEMFFDVNGVFYYKKIPTGENDAIEIDDTLFDSIVISESISVDFQNIKNSIEVYGKAHDPAHFSTDTKVSNNVISLTITDVKEYQDGMIYGFTLKDNIGYVAPSLKINSLATLPIKLLDGDKPANIDAESGEVYYCVQYKKTYWNWLGHLQAYGKAEDTNQKSPYYINGTVGKIHLPLFGADYDVIFTDDLARQRAEYELWLHTNMNNSISLNCIPVPWIDVNTKVRYTQRRNGKAGDYIIKSVNFGFGTSDTMNINMIKFYPEDTKIVKE